LIPQHIILPFHLSFRPSPRPRISNNFVIGRPS